jgi:cell division protein FtsZ
MMAQMIKFDSPKNQSSIIKVLGVGGGGSNAVNHMFSQGIKGVDFIICNTDAQALQNSKVPNRIQLGSKGLGAGSVPSVGREAAIENIEQIKSLLETNTQMLFITAGMGGGTGTGGAPVIAQVAKELGVLTVGIITLPFSFEGRKRRQQADLGVEELRKYVDTLLVISNDKLREQYGNLKLSEAFAKADDILTTAARGIAEIITVPGYINVDFEDVKTVMKESGVAIMGTGVAEGEIRAQLAVEQALNSPLLNDNNIKGANNILLYVASGKDEISMDEVSEITEYIQNEAGHNAEIIWGNGIEEGLSNKISITIIATGFAPNRAERKAKILSNEKKVVHNLDEEGILSEKRIFANIEELSNEIKLINKPGELLKKQSLSFESTLSELNSIPLEMTTAGQLSKDEINTPPILNNDPNDVQEEEVGNISLLNTSRSLRVDPDPLNDAEISDIEARAKERIRKLKDLSLKLRTPGGLAELENEPAYLRRNVKLSEVPPSSTSFVAKYTLSVDDENQGEIRTNNSFLHDNVD